MGILSPSVGVDSHGCASPLILGGPTSPSGSGEGFLFLAVLATGRGRKEKGKNKNKINGCAPKRTVLLLTQDSLKNLFSQSLYRKSHMNFQCTCNSQHLRLTGLWGRILKGHRTQHLCNRLFLHKHACTQAELCTRSSTSPNRLKGGWCPHAPIQECAGKGKPCVSAYQPSLTHLCCAASAQEHVATKHWFRLRQIRKLGVCCFWAGVEW